MQWDIDRISIRVSSISSSLYVMYIHMYLPTYHTYDLELTLEYETNRMNNVFFYDSLLSL